MFGRIRGSNASLARKQQLCIRLGSIFNHQPTVDQKGSQWAVSSIVTHLIETNPTLTTYKTVLQKIHNIIMLHIIYQTIDFVIIIIILWQPGIIFITHAQIIDCCTTQSSSGLECKVTAWNNIIVFLRMSLEEDHTLVDQHM